MNSQFLSKAKRFIVMATMLCIIMGGFSGCKCPEWILDVYSFFSGRTGEWVRVYINRDGARLDYMRCIEGGHDCAPGSPPPLGDIR
ncbi:MAG: hypothetical protein KAR42_13630 [candidate division Zixibacteria bacterium]|nr:hypothetical protein [candidate division Zixibacteria bacterium]